MVPTVLKDNLNQSSVNEMCKCPEKTFNHKFPLFIYKRANKEIRKKSKKKKQTIKLERKYDTKTKFIPNST